MKQKTLKESAKNAFQKTEIKDLTSEKLKQLPIKKKIGNIVRKKIWPKYFEEILQGKKKIDLRLGNFEIKKDDTLILEEFDPKTKKYTGRKVERKVKNITKVNPLEFYSAEDLKKYPLLIIEI